MGRGKAKVQAEREGPWGASNRKVRRGERETPCRSPTAVMGPLALEGRARRGGKGGAQLFASQGLRFQASAETSKVCHRLSAWERLGREVTQKREVRQQAPIEKSDKARGFRRVEAATCSRLAPFCSSARSALPSWRGSAPSDDSATTSTRMRRGDAAKASFHSPGTKKGYSWHLSSPCVSAPKPL